LHIIQQSGQIVLWEMGTALEPVPAGTEPGPTKSKAAYASDKESKQRKPG
jgi:hypothetical protein